MSIEVARSREEVLELRPAWEVLRSPFVTSDLDFVLTYVRHTPTVVRPHAVVVGDEQGPFALACSRVEDVSLPAKLGTRTIVSPTVRALTVTYGGLMGRVDETTGPGPGSWPPSGTPSSPERST